jgi:type II secretory pathway pseudopilin PulG
VKYDPLKSSSGFTYIAALMLVVIMGIMLGVAAQSWTMIMKREREAELLFRGKQIVEAIAQWQNPTGAAGVTRPSRSLNDLKDLLMDPGSVAKKRYLRKDPNTSYNDPITGKEWEVIRDNARGGIIGVASKSEEKPLKQKNFLEMFYPLDPQRDNYLITMFKGFEGKRKYKDWQFVYLPGGQQATSGKTPVSGK